MKPKVGIIGGSGVYELSDLVVTHRETIESPYGEPSCPLVFGSLHGNEVVFIARHGLDHTIAPHSINYRANIWALHHFGVRQVIAINAVGGISSKMNPVKLVIPHQIIDYTHSRKHTFYDEGDDLNHVDFTLPYCQHIRQYMINAAQALALDHEAQGVYGATQGPRLESIAEINRMQGDGCDVVGMTGMPEASLARELDLEYACCAVVVNWAAGKNSDQLISMNEIERNLVTGTASVNQLLVHVLAAIFEQSSTATR